MKILITTDQYAPDINGVVTSVVNLQNELQKLGHEVRILTLSGNRKSSHKDEVIYIGSTGVGKIYPKARLALSIHEEYIQELVGWHPDIIHSQCEFSTFLMAQRIAKDVNIPIIHTYHTLYEDYTHYFSPNKKWGKKMVAILTKKVLTQSNCVIAPTDKVRSLLLEYGVKQEIQVVPTGIDLERVKIQLGNTEKEGLRSKVGIPSNDRVLIYVGRLAKEKNLEEILLFFSQLNRQNITLLIVGDGPHRAALEERVMELGISNQVIFTGMICSQEVSSYYQLGDLFVSASNSETQGLTYIEALANGVPALCRKDPCLENVIVDGVNGWEYQSFEQFREKLNTILDDEVLQERVSKNARDSMRYNYSSTEFAKKVEQIYQNTINRHHEKLKDTSVSDIQQ
ncbi:glycosyltransferase family 4 protein [Alkalibacterium sp. 20]|uniref:glycosyltransferase family 4 protein n=1 Tax=Alkalibacterium sp. 20 TaxID=1798803 RepID=UPI0009003292|nr:glycosyltransferase family 4 protein [Alkalibacterium sp. 20]OJF91530.1 glycosyl transferase family 1 [Alkalibacterium sp. 20]